MMQYQDEINMKASDASDISNLTDISVVSTFSKEVKDEMCNVTGKSLHCKITELAAFISINGEIRIKCIESNEGISGEYDYADMQLVIKTDIDNCKSKMLQLIKKIHDTDIEDFLERALIIVKSDRIEITDIDLIRKIFATSKLKAEGESLVANDEKDFILGLRKVVEKITSKKQEVYKHKRIVIKNFFVDNIVIERTCCKKAFLRGCFIASGSVTNPEKSYHLEIVLEDEERLKQLQSVVKSFGLESKSVIRKKYFVFYIKDNARIIDFLNITEAYNSSMKIENVVIVRDLRNSINRQVNCDTANMEKIANAAVKMIDEIMLIDKHIGIDNLPENLKQIAKLRIEEPNMSLKELGENMTPPITKSGVNHRLKKLSEMAEQIKNKC